MAINIKKLLDGLSAADKDFYQLEIENACKGDCDAVAHLAFGMRESAVKKEDYLLQRDLFQWLVDQGVEKYEAFVIELEHEANPSVGYSELEVKKLMALCRRDGVSVFGILVKAVQSDTALFHRFKSQTIQLCKQLSRTANSFEKKELTCWHELLLLDARLKCSEQEREKTLLSLNSHLKCDSDPYIAIGFLEAAMHWRPKMDDSLDFEMALSIIQTCEHNDEHCFYNGLDALYEADYKRAYQSFCDGSAKRCRIAQAYCLINGVGTAVDMEAGRSILKDYPEDGFALYLVAISLYRSTDHELAIADDIVELLEESFRLGYKPANSTVAVMQLCAKTRAQGELSSEMEKVVKLAAKSRELEANAFIRYLSFMKAVAIHLGLMDQDIQGEMDQDYAEDLAEEFLSCIATVKDNANQTPLACYSRAYLDGLENNESNEGEWFNGLTGLNQSPYIRLCSLAHCLIGGLFHDLTDKADRLMRFLKNMGASNRELAVWSAALQIARHKNEPEAYEAAKAGFVETFKTYRADPLVNLIVAALNSNDITDSEDQKEVRTLLAETEGFTKPILAFLRDRLILESGLVEEFELYELKQEIDGSSLDIVDHFLGYQFFDYTC